MERIRQDLLCWYDGAARKLPWRGTRDPYAIWVSEVMLQQTRVETVIPYYERFLQSFPTPEALAEADEDAVLSHWSGLGYYRRARLLQAGVREVVARYGGKVPEDTERREQEYRRQRRIATSQGKPVRLPGTAGRTGAGTSTATGT